jgi:predicted nucleotide-binding protein
MPAKKIFVASSSEAIPYAKAFMAKCQNQKRIKYYPWWDEFIAGRTLVDELNRLKGTLDGALIIMTPDSNTTLRGTRRKIPNLNVLFEFGYFFGVFKQDHVAIVKYGSVYLPSDLDGYIPIYGGTGYTPGSKVAPPPVARTKAEFLRWLAKL